MMSFVKNSWCLSCWERAESPIIVAGKSHHTSQTKHFQRSLHGLKTYEEHYHTSLQTCKSVLTDRHTHTHRKTHKPRTIILQCMRWGLTVTYVAGNQKNIEISPWIIYSSVCFRNLFKGGQTSSAKIKGEGKWKSRGVNIKILKARKANGGRGAKAPPVPWNKPCIAC